MGFLFTFVLGLAHLKEDKTLYTQFVKHDQHGAGAGNNLWTELAAGLHSNIMELHVQTMSTWREFRLLEQHHQLGIHIYNISGVKPHFTYHSLRTFGFTKHLYFLQIGHHVHYITNITCFIQDFRHNIWVYRIMWKVLQNLWSLVYSFNKSWVRYWEQGQEYWKQLTSVHTISNWVFLYFPKIGQLGHPISRQPNNPHIIWRLHV